MLLLVDHEDRVRSRADQLGQELAQVLDDGGEADRRVELVAGHVEVGEIRELLFDLREARRKPVRHGLGLGELGEEGLLLLLELVDLLQRLADRVVAPELRAERRVVRLRLAQGRPEALVLLESSSVSSAPFLKKVLTNAVRCVRTSSNVSARFGGRLFLSLIAPRVSPLSFRKLVPPTTTGRLRAHAVRVAATRGSGSP